MTTPCRIIGTASVLREPRKRRFRHDPCRQKGGSASRSSMRTTVLLLIARLSIPGAVTERGKLRRQSSSCCGVKPSWATECTSSPSNRYTPPCSAPQSRTAFRTMVSKTGCASVCDSLITRKISLDAVCCSSDSVRALVISAYDGAGGPLGLAVRGVPHASQNFAGGRFSCGHRGHGMPGTSLAGARSA